MGYLRNDPGGLGFTFFTWLTVMVVIVVLVGALGGFDSNFYKAACWGLIGALLLIAAGLLLLNFRLPQSKKIF